MEGPSGEKLQMAQAKVRIAEMVLQERQQVNPLRPSQLMRCSHGGSGVRGQSVAYATTLGYDRAHRLGGPKETLETPQGGNPQIWDGLPASLPADQL